MEAEFKSIIEKNLPAQVGDVLKRRLEQADIDANRVKEVENLLEARNSHIENLKSEIVGYKKFDERNSTLMVREAAADEKERNFKIVSLEYQLLAEKDKTKFSMDVAMGLVRNTEYKRDVFNSKTGPEGVDQYGQMRHVTHTVMAQEVNKAI